MIHSYSNQFKHCLVHYHGYKYKLLILHFYRDLISGHDTVGAVAMDIQGRMACATSTGGISCKQPGRVGDSPILGKSLIY